MRLKFRLTKYLQLKEDVNSTKNAREGGGKKQTVNKIPTSFPNHQANPTPNTSHPSHTIPYALPIHLDHGSLRVSISGWLSGCRARRKDWPRNHLPIFWRRLRTLILFIDGGDESPSVGLRSSPA